MDLWRVRVSEQAHALAVHWQRLDAAERQRAASFRNEADRQRYVVARGTLRALLGNALNIAPHELTFGRHEFGKPFVASHPGLHFSSSRSGDWVLHGLSTDIPLGVDVEALPHGPLELELFGQVLAPQELARLLALPAARRKLAFIELWVCKEAYVKAIGQGLNRTLGAICIAPLEGGGYTVLHDENPEASAGPWTLVMLDLGPAHAGCLAHPGSPRELGLHDYSDPQPRPSRPTMPASSATEKK